MMDMSFCSDIKEEGHKMLIFWIFWGAMFIVFTVNMGLLGFALWSGLTLLGVIASK